jgi:hypothetical protein
LKIRSTDGGESWSDPGPVFSMPPQGKWAGRGPQPLVDHNGDLHLMLLDLGPRYQETWHTKYIAAQRKWTKLQKIGPSLPQNSPIQLRSGRIVFPIGYQFREQDWRDPLVRHLTTYHSDDAGITWQRSPSTLVVPASPDHQGVGKGGHEPVIVELRDGTVWMLIRTQRGWLYESSSKDGREWSEPVASRFRSSDAPGSIVRLPSGELVLLWNNSEDPTPVDGKWIYTGRDALHGAISSDDGKTWQGFREVYVDPFRNEDPPPRGDFGTGYPNAAKSPNGKIVFIAGQNTGRCRMFLLDPAWLKETVHEDDFARGLDGWSVFKSYGPVRSYRRSRVAGAQRIQHPSKANAWVLHLRRPDEKIGDGASWNFPTGRRGEVKVRLLLKKGFGGGLITLTDRFIYPDDANPSKVVFALPIDADGTIADSGRLEFDRWHTLKLTWRVELDPPKGGWPGTCSVKLDGKEVGVRPQLNRARSGLSYLRLHSTAQEIDQAGFLIENVKVQVKP